MQATLITHEKTALITLFTDFLKEIGLHVVLESYDAPSFLPGVRIKMGGLSIDSDRLLYPGDILHEAGHLATQPYHIRCELDGDLPDTDLHRGGELMALAWSYAACLHLQIPAQIVFHEHGYKGEHEHLIRNFEAGRYIGLPMLQYHGMAYDEKNALQLNTKPFPHMENWLCLKGQDA
ncbi:hypothetical protein CLV51_102895 [Chitinophaga niastensis]|uniref:Uncharacterized protein n=1 Tax=Chitinophaga niastensis TaxID=536980 RepID=A0A2P8HPB0_CHINA|nr:hypothetical protein [Chitinophaga niastensis]PSL48035.1 hypothetical protein CLV51_102895 [Chitinophaga niastensis]